MYGQLLRKYTSIAVGGDVRNLKPVNVCPTLCLWTVLSRTPDTISRILPWDRQSYLTHAILPRLSRECYTDWLHWNACTLSSSDVIVMLKWGVFFCPTLTLMIDSYSPSIQMWRKNIAITVGGELQHLKSV